MDTGTALTTSLGNHEFDNGVSGLVPFIEKLTCPVVAANLVLDNVPELEQVVNLRKSIIISVGDTKVGVIGYLTPDTKIFARPNEVLYIREIDAIRVEVTKLKENGIKIIIALGHSGYATDLDVAKEVEGIDLVIGGHTHTFLWNGTRPDTEDPVSPYPTYVKNSSGKMVPVVQAYAYTKYLGKLHITFDREGEVINLDGEPILLDTSIPQDMEVLNIINRYKNDSMDTLKDFEDIVGNASVVLDGQTCKRAECNLGNLISDAMIYAYASKCIGEHWIDSSIALLDGGSIRSSIDHAELPTTISKADIFAVMPFEDKLVKITMNGSILLNLLEHAVANYDSLDDPRVFLQHSGLRVIYDIKRPPGARVVKAKARCSVCDIPTYYPIMPADVYNVITVDFIAGGGDGYSMLVGLRNEDFGYTIRMAIEDYIRHYGVIYPKLEERITML